MTQGRYQWPVAEPGELQAVLEQIVQRLGGQRAAARKSGIAQPTLQRLLRRRNPRRIAAHVFHKLGGVLIHHVKDKRLLRRLGLSVFTVNAERKMNAYIKWLGKEVVRLERLSRPIADRLQATEPYRSMMEHFLDVGAGEYEERVKIALYRAVEPLAAADRTRNFEVTWQELHAKGTLERFLKLSLARELLLLDRKDGALRAFSAPR